MEEKRNTVGSTSQRYYNTIASNLIKLYNFCVFSFFKFWNFLKKICENFGKKIFLPQF